MTEGEDFDGPYGLTQIQLKRRHPIGQLTVKRSKSTMPGIDVLTVRDEVMFYIADAYIPTAAPHQAEAEQWMLDIVNARRTG